MANDNTDDLIISISTDQATLRRSIKRIESDLGTLAGTVKKQFDAVGRTVDTSVQSSLQNRINAMVGIGTKGAKEWTGALADQGKELERLRARYSPLFNTINNYKSAVADIRQAHALGAISSNEMAAAISRERQAALAATAAIKGRNAALADTPVQRGMGNGSQSFNTSNLAAQGFDVAATAAFMPWYTVALQQGPQVAQVFNDIRGSGAAIGPAVAGAFMQIVNPVSLVTIGVIGATAALIQYLSSAGDVKSADDILKGHAETIALLKERYGEAAEGLRDYVNEGMSGTVVDIKDRLKDAREAIVDAAQNRSTYSTFIQPFAGSTDAKIVAEYRNAFIELRASIREGEPDLLSFRNAMASIAENNDAPEEVRELAAEMREFDPEVVKVARSIPGMVQQLELIGGTAINQVAGVAALSKALQDLSGIAPTQLTDLQSAAKIRDSALSDPRNNTEAAVREIENAYNKAIERINNQNPTIINSDGYTTSVPVPGQKPVTLGDKPAKASRGSTRATASDRFTADIQALRDRSAAIQQEMALIGLSNQQQVERRTALDLEQSALRDLREEARRKGQMDLDSIKLSPEKIATIQAEAAAYAKQAEALRLAQDQQQKLVEMNAFARDVTRGFIGDLLNGEGAAVTFANALSKIGDALLDDVLDAIFKVNGAASGGGGLIGQLFGGLFGGGGFKANTTFGSFITNGFSSGGYTGPGGINDVAGLVHKDEVVFSKADVARNGGVAATEALRLKGSPTLAVPMAPTLSRANVSGNVTTPIAISIDATGADAAGLARVERQLARLQADLPATVVRTVQNAQGRRAL